MANMRRIGTTATRVMVTNGLISVAYHNTEVVNRGADGRITLDSGGWRTVTTKTRMNKASAQYGLEYVVYAKRGTWYVDYNGHTFVFEDGMVLGGRP